MEQNLLSSLITYFALIFTIVSSIYFFSCRPHPEQEIILKPNSYGYPHFRDILWLLIYSLHRVREGRNWLWTKKGRDCPWIEPLQFGFPDQLKSTSRSDGPIHVQFAPKVHVWFRDRYLQPRPTRKSLSTLCLRGKGFGKAHLQRFSWSLEQWRRHQRKHQRPNFH